MGDRVEPEQISHRLKVDFPDDESMRISHEAIYQSLFIQGRGALKREFVTACEPAAHSASHGLERRTARKGMSPRTSCSLSARGGSRPRSPRALGGRSDHGHGPVRDRHDRRTQEPLDPAGASPAAGRPWRDTARQERVPR